MQILVVQSGSKGNATLVINEGRILLIDMGITLLSLEEALKTINKNVYNIEGMLLTHEHSDHTKGITYLPPLPIYTFMGTYDSPQVVNIKPNKAFNLGGLEIIGVSTSHDVKNPCGFVLKNSEETLVYITDTGIIPKKTLKHLKNADYYVFESNFDEEMLLKSNRPEFLKQRILSNKGHLSNEQSANYLSELIGKKTNEIILAHISEETNTPEVALKTHKRIYKDKGISLKGIKLHCANQHTVVEGGRK